MTTTAASLPESEKMPTGETRTKTTTPILAAILTVCHSTWSQGTSDTAFFR